MPRLSVVLVVHREQAQLEPLAASVLDQGFADVELVAIDDASPDHGPELLDDLARRDARVRVEHLPRRIGLGAARNRALDVAGGDFVWFVEATDRLAPGSLAAVDERLRETGADVLALHHTEVDAAGERRPGPHRRLLARAAERGPGPLEARRSLAALAPDAWSKVLRRELLASLGVRFGDGGHGELPVTWPALLAAERIAATRAARYVRREVPNAVRDALTAGSPEDVFAQADAVFAFLDAHPEIPAARRALVPPALLEHQLALLAALPEPERRAFFARIAASWRAHAPAAVPGGRVARLRAGLVARGAYGSFRALEGALERRRARAAAAADERREAAARERQAELEAHYRERLAQPLDPELAVYAAYWYRGCSCNPRAIYEKARELAPDVRGVWVVERKWADRVPAGVEHVIAGTREYYDLIARASTFVNNVNFPNHLVKRPGTVHVMTHHGTPLKRMGIDLRDTPGGGERIDYAALLRRCARWDFSVSANPHSTLVWERVYPTAYESLETGYPRNDALANATDEDVARARAALGLDGDRVAILHAPTHREYEREPRPHLDLAALVDALGPDHVVLARPHYFHGADPRLRELRERGRVIDVAAHPSVEELCLAADALLTDYSSIMFDYAVLDRPIVIHAPDWEAYRALRGVYFDLLSEGPGVVARSEAEVGEAFRSGAWRGEEAARRRAAFRERFCALEDGRAAERVVRRVFLGEREAAGAAVAAGAR